MSEHILYTLKDFEKMSWEEQDENFLYDCVVNGGLNVCKVCGEYESGLDKPCRPNAKETEKMDYIYELERLQAQNGTNDNLRVFIYINKEDLIEKNSDDYISEQILIEDLDFLPDNTPIYVIDNNTGFPSYYDDPKEAYDSI